MRVTKKQLEQKIYELEKDIHSLVRGSEQDKFQTHVKWELIYKLNDSIWEGEFQQGFKMDGLIENINKQIK
jgi:hypothetical protein